MKKRSKVLSCKDEDRNKKNIYTNNIQRKLETITSSKDLELCLEVEMDDEVRDLIKNPEKSPSTLLDVTVIKPKGVDNLYTTEKQTLNASLVKKMITSMKIGSDEKRNLLQKIFGDAYVKEKSADQVSSRKSCLSTKSRERRNLEQGDIQSLSERISKVLSVYSQETNKSVKFKERASRSLPRKIEHQVYAAPKTNNNIRAMFQCTNKESDDGEKSQDSRKIDPPCHCQNCAVVGILTDSQKVPFATEEIPQIKPKQESRRERRSYLPSRKKSVSFKHSPEPNSIPPTSFLRDHSQCETVFKRLTDRIHDLEERVRQQEEKAIPKDYFKKIITKLVSHLTKLTHYTTLNEDRLSAKDQPPYKFSSSNPRGKTYDSNYNNKFYVNHCQVPSSKPPTKFAAEKEYDPKPCSSQEDDPIITINVAKNNLESERLPDYYLKESTNSYPPKYGQSIPVNASLWKWGGEILRPGIDLKNKIMVLLEEALQNVKKSWEKPPPEQRIHEDLQRFLEEVSKNLPRNNRRPEFHRQKSRERRHSKFTPIRESNSDSSTLPWNKFSRKSKQPILSPRFVRKKDSLNVPQANVNIAYVNPEIKQWIDSQVSFKIHSSEELRSNNEDETMKQYKLHFLDMISSSKTTDKFKLWQSIWNQALATGQTKNDSVVVQIPDPKDPHRLVKIDYTIGDIERLLTGVADSVAGGKSRKR